MTRLRRHATLGNALILCALIVTLTVLTRRVGDPDFWWHISSGNWILQNHALPAHDLYTYTVPANGWADLEYGSELIMAEVFNHGGFVAVSLFFAAVTWAGFWLIWKRIAIERAPAVVVAVVLALAAIAGEAVWGPRTQMITFALLCLELYWIERFLRGQSRALFFMPLVIVVWANLHAGFTAAILFLGIACVTQGLLAAVRRSDRGVRHQALQLLALTVASALAGCANIHGLGVYGDVLLNQSNSLGQNFIAEWQTPNFHDLTYAALMLMILLLPLAFAFRRPSLWDVALAASGTVIALTAIRNGVIFIAEVAPVLAWSYGRGWDNWVAPRIAPYLPRGTEQLALGAAAIVVAAGGTAVFARHTLQGQTASTEANFPVGAADWLAAHPDVGTHMLNASDWGGYLIYRFYPIANRRVFIYGEYLVMGPQLIQDIYNIEHSEPGWQAILQQYDVDYVIDRPNSPLIQELSVDPGWHTVYDDGFAVIDVRNSGSLSS